VGSGGRIGLVGGSGALRNELRMGRHQWRPSRSPTPDIIKYKSKYKKGMHHTETSVKTIFEQQMGQMSG
jgi:hypothetical protein